MGEVQEHLDGERSLGGNAMLAASADNAEEGCLRSVCLQRFAAQHPAQR